MLPEWGGVALSGVTNADVRAWAARLHLSGLSASSVRKAVFALRRILAAAVADAPAGRSLPAEEAGEQRYVTADEIATLAETIAPRFRATVLVAAYGGCAPASSPPCARAGGPAPWAEAGAAAGRTGP